MNLWQQNHDMTEKKDEEREKKENKRRRIGQLAPSTRDERPVVTKNYCS